jgi:HEAT repeat protein
MIMRQHTFVLTAMTLLAAPVIRAQSIASRVAQAPDGVVHMQFEARAGACGDGRDAIGFGHSFFGRNFESMGRWHDTRCVPGPLRVSLTTSHGEVTAVRSQIGGAWPSSDGRVTELGTVPSRDASAFFFSLVPKLESASGKDRLLLPAVLADNADVVAPLLALARDERRTSSTRRSAIQWIGQMGSASEVPALVAFAKDASDDDSDKPGKKSLGSAATAALGYLPDGAGIPSLIELARTGPIGTRRNAVFWLGQSGDARALRVLHGIIEDKNEDSKVRQHAIFSLANNSDNPQSEFTWLRSVYSRLETDQLKEAVLQGIAQDGETGGRWLVQRARDENESLKLRRSALFWAGQREETSTADLVSVYRDVSETNLREHAIFVLSQRQDDQAMNALLDIARSDKDTRMRGKAMFWLAQKKDPRVTKLISDLVLK